ncbi:ATP-grasp fold amidoligase family protein [Clostridium perfringens]|uniref:ATP-grasp fold amidoligase family protein n=1 Tax=Clostridium perfringens TaxID=1502 RepID=UPI0018E483EA|nr:ATP-grasp fold amidoligase family protein [Clostridium perfringens]MBI6066231.1 glycosyl transferase [Clostridium perfringens]MDK0606745.1 ATP-grasp fold amidoligase family protein [Clostridium perfringens]MDZ5031024.1 glycosyl transferase [Clostridium perfringens]
MNKVKIYKKINRFIPDKLFLILNYTMRFKRLPNIINPKRYTEKVQLRMIHDNMMNYTDFVDKYKVRNFIKDKIGEKYLIDLLGVYNNANEIDFNKLPQKFVIKSNHGSGYFLVCKDKNKLDLVESRKKINSWIYENYYNKCKEKQYKNIERKIICEKLIEGIEEDFLDCRVYCFNGKPEFIQIDKGFADGKTRRNHYDVDWNLMDLKMKYHPIEETIKKPKNLIEILNLAKILSEQFDFVRVDFYLSDEEIYFSELTFSPAGGRQALEPDNYDFKYGKKLNVFK